MEPLDSRLAALKAKSAHTAGVSSLVLFGSTTVAGASRRDRWSDIDFNLFTTEDAAGEISRKDWDFLPAPERIVLRAREGGDGGVVLYDDGVIFEFGAGLPWPIHDPDHEVVLDGGDISFGQPPVASDALNQLNLFIIKLMIGYGRIMRGEVIAGNFHLRTYAVGCLCTALRLRLFPHLSANPFDAARRFETGDATLASRVSVAQLLPAQDAALEFLQIAEDYLQEGWDDFPVAALQVARRWVCERAED